MYKYRNIILLITVAVLLAASPIIGRAETQKTITMGASFTSVGGLSASEVFQITDQLLTLVMERHNLKVVLKKYFTGEELIEAFLKNEIDAAPLYSFNIAYILDNGGKVMPLASYTLNNEKMLHQCLWQSSKKQTKSLEDVRGKIFIRHDFSIGPFIQMRDLLYDHGIDEPLWKFFDKIIISPNSNSAFMSIVMGDADYYLTPDELENTLKIFMPQVADKVNYQICTDKTFGHPMLALNGKTVDQATFDLTKIAFKDFVTHTSEYAKENQMAKMLQQYMKIYGVKIVPANEDFYKEEIKLYQKAKKMGWLEETNFILSKMANEPTGSAVEVKMDYSDCKKWCEKNASKDGIVKCLDTCLGTN